MRKRRMRKNLRTRTPGQCIPQVSPGVCCVGMHPPEVWQASGRLELAVAPAEGTSGRLELAVAPAGACGGTGPGIQAACQWW